MKRDIEPEGRRERMLKEQESESSLKHLSYSNGRGEGDP